MILALALPWIGGIALALLDGRRPAVAWTAVGILAAVLAALARLALVAPDSLVVTGGWPAGVGITLRTDALGLAFAIVSVASLLGALVYTTLTGIVERTLPALVLLLAAGLVGCFVTGDIFNFYVFFEMSMAAGFVLAGYGRAEREVRAALVFMVVNMLGSVLFLTGVAALYHLTGTLEMRAMAERLATTPPPAALLPAVLLFVALSTKLGIFPFHFWLPPIYRDASPTVAAILSGALANIGSYGLLRFGSDLLPAQLAVGAPALLVLGAISILYGAHQAVSVRTASEALAYSTIGQAGYIMLGLGVGGPVGVGAAVLYAVVNPLNKTLLFLATGLRGPLVGAAFAIGAMSVAGVPPAIGFVGKLAILRVGLETGSPLLIGVILLGGALSFVYMFQIHQRAFWRAPASPPPARGAAAVVLALAVLVLALGVWPEPLVGVTGHVGQHVTTPAVAAGSVDP
ncbi:MAG TPA: proton-conducting transporter membrane subunit [Candidatus Tectomicrobia bacterium]|nr:proton-conducting transporter membrane subunit [Candidatus Tectomicrobia bacterium]